MKQGDTIVALSTPPGAGARAVVRMSGPCSFAIASAVASFPAGRRGASYAAARARISIDGGKTVQGAVYLMKSPRSYTSEDVAELHVPGSPAICSAVIRLCLLSGARAARPGEFTFRAFMNGRIDLSQAEAVDRIIRASDSSARRAAVLDAGGRLSAETAALTARVRAALALVEASIDFPDEVAGGPERSEAGAMLRSAAARARAAAGEGAGMRPAAEPLVLLAGRANAGKSSLLNALAGRDVSLVSPVPGTTRDIVAHTLVLNGLRMTIADPAGMGGEPGDIGAMAARMFEKWLAAADAIVAVADASAPPGADEEKLAGLCAGRPCVWALNKSDLPSSAGRDLSPGKGAVSLRVSALTGEGLPDLALAISKLAGGAGGKSPDSFGLSARQRAALSAAADACGRAAAALEAGADEICALEAREAIESLGLIGGRNLTEEVLAGIFSGFCVGK